MTIHNSAFHALAEDNQMSEREKQLEDALSALVNAKSLAGVREQVAGWNGENLPEGPHLERHPYRLGATLPKTCCGEVYELDEAMQTARALLAHNSANIYIRRNGSFGSSCDGIADTGHEIAEDSGRFTVWSLHDEDRSICIDAPREIAEQAIAADWRAEG